MSTESAERTPGAVQRLYWDAAAPQYATTYVDRWSACEDRQIADELRSLVPPGKTIVDIGCGQGLGARILALAGVPLQHYVGIDLSLGMLQMAPPIADGSLLQGDAVDLPLASGSAGVIISLFSALSYVEDLDAAFEEIARVLPSDGVFLTMHLSRWSLRRLAARRFASREEFGSRFLDVDGLDPAPVTVFGVRPLRGKLAQLASQSTEHSANPCSLVLVLVVAARHGG